MQCGSKQWHAWLEYVQGKLNSQKQGMGAWGSVRGEVIAFCSPIRRLLQYLQKCFSSRLVKADTSQWGRGAWSHVTPSSTDSNLNSHKAQKRSYLIVAQRGIGWYDTNSFFTPMDLHREGARPNTLQQMAIQGTCTPYRA